MRIAIIYNDEDVFVEIKPKTFKKLLKSYMGVSKRSKTSQKVDKAIEKIILDLKNKTKYA